MISGLQKMTLLDYPGKVACTVFLQGCNFRCPFCHNSDLLGHENTPFMELEDFIAFLSRRQGLLDGVCISGGEPTLAHELEEMTRRIKALDFLIKLDTNGSNPLLLKKLVREGLVDYVAMDIKNSPAAYPATAGLSHPPMEKLEESIRFLIRGDLAYEFRTTVAEPLHSEESIAAMGRWLHCLAEEKMLPKLFIQPFADRDSVLESGLRTPDQNKLESYLALLSPYFREVAIRG